MDSRRRSRTRTQGGPGTNTPVPLQQRYKTIRVPLEYAEDFIRSLFHLHSLLCPIEGVGDALHNLGPRC